MKDAGSFSEAVFACEAIKRGWYVYTTNIGHNEPADAIIFRPPGRPITIQIKTASLRKDRKNAYNLRTGRGCNHHKYPYRKGDFDVMAAWLPDKEEFVFFPFDDLRGRLQVTYCTGCLRQPGNWEVLDDVTFGHTEV